MLVIQSANGILKSENHKLNSKVATVGGENIQLKKEIVDLEEKNKILAPENESKDKKKYDLIGQLEIGKEQSKK